MSTDDTSRRSRLVMALGIATIILFSANLLSVLVKHFWPDKAEYALFTSSEDAEFELAPLAEYEVRLDVDTRRAARRKHRVVMRFPKHRTHDSSDRHSHGDALDSEIAEMEEAAQRLARELNHELSSFQTEEIAFGTARALEVARRTLEGQEIRVQLHKEIEADVEADLEDMMRNLEIQIEESLSNLKERTEDESSSRRTRKRRIRQ